MQTRTRPDGAVEATSEKPKSKGKKTLTRIEIEPAENGGAAVRCIYDHSGMGYREPSLKAYGSIDEALAGVKAILGGKSESDKDED